MTEPQKNDEKHPANILRGSPWLMAALICIVVVWFKAEHQVMVLIWSLSKVCVGAFMGYWIDRSLIPSGRPIEAPDATTANWSRMRRGIVISATIIALGLGV